MSTKKKLTAIVSTLLISFIFVGCGTLGRLNKEDTLRVGVDPNRNPVIYKVGNKYSGFEAEFAKLLAAKVKKTLVFVPMNRSKLVTALEKGDIDIIMSGISMTEMRQLRINFTQPYMRIYQTSLFRRTDIRKYSSPQMILLSNDRMGVEKNSTGEMFVQQSFQPGTITTFSTLESGAKALMKNKIDILIGDLPLICRLGAVHEADGLIYMLSPFAQEYYAWAVAKDNPELLAQANELLTDLKQSKKLDKIITQYFTLYPQLKLNVN
ncbi:MAG: ABC transporter substrate-binding protein [Kiritimatiellae bacterium]|jgi:ABC-type amino acid transport substrate-binding protein|nr:ABC transporter substrate-binding protein [Kiritimatiellia bacterium]